MTNDRVKDKCFCSPCSLSSVFSSYPPPQPCLPWSRFSSPNIGEFTDQPIRSGKFITVLWNTWQNRLKRAVHPHVFVSRSCHMFRVFLHHFYDAARENSMLPREKGGQFNLRQCDKRQKQRPKRLSLLRKYWQLCPHSSNFWWCSLRYLIPFVRFQTILKREIPAIAILPPFVIWHPGFQPFPSGARHSRRVEWRPPRKTAANPRSGSSSSRRPCWVALRSCIRGCRGGIRWGSLQTGLLNQ